MIALLALSGVTAAAGQSPPAGLECGDTITADTTLDRDLTGCPSNGIIIGADDITLDLNGHTISGDGKPVRRCPRRQPCDMGVATTAVTASPSATGRCEGSRSACSSAACAATGLVGLSSSREPVLRLRDRRLCRNASSATARPPTTRGPTGTGSECSCSHDLRIVSNSFRRNGQIGIHIENSTGNLIKGNEFVRNGDFGVFVQADGNQVRGNSCVRGWRGHPGRPRQPERDRRQPGHPEAGRGSRIEKGRGNVVARNVVARTRHSGIRLGIGDPPIGSTDTLVRGNLVTAAGKDGFLVAKNDRNALLRGNTARRSGDDGFDINSRSARLRHNHALGSAGEGFELHG